MKSIITLVVALSTGTFVYAQEETKNSESKIKVSGYLETYYGYDFNRPVNNTRPSYIYSHNRHNEINLNLGFIKGGYDNGAIRTNIALMAGTYSNANMAAEPGVLKNVYEANVGFKLSEKTNLWLDAGIFPSHIGFESAVSKDCWVLTRNISSENTPYFESGAKLSYSTTDGKFTAILLYLNGWQRINRLDGNSKPAGGLQLTWKPNEMITVNYSNYLGTEGADEVRVYRFYHNVYGIFQLTDDFGLTVGIDYGTQQKAKGLNENNEVLSPVIIAQYKIDDRWKIAGRIEYYQDKNGVFITTETPKGFKTTGFSLNLDYAPVNNAVIRLEGKHYDSKSTAVTASIAVSF